METTEKKIIIIAGPTAVGKTAVSVELAKKLKGEIISADSMQIYKGMDIGTAKISSDEMQGIRHHLIDIAEPDEEFTAAHYSTEAKKKIASLLSRGKTPIIVGGTGLYINTLLYEMDFNVSEPDREFRRQMEALRVEKGNDFLYGLLQKKSPETAKILHPNNYKRVIRALEILSRKETVDSFAALRKPAMKGDCAVYVLSMDRGILYERIDRRVSMMIQEGLEEEVRRLLERGFSEELPSMKGIGYRQMIQYIQGEISLEQAAEMIRRDSRRYAKRQLTWFRRYPEAVWIDVLQKDVAEIAHRIEIDFYKNRS